MRALLFGMSGRRERGIFSLDNKTGSFGAAGKPPSATD
jgi:hypothetical protein